MKNEEKTTKPTGMKERFIEDMKVKKYADSTVDMYVREVKRFFERHCPDKTPTRVTEADFRNYMIHLATERDYSGSSMKIAFSGLKFFFCTTMKRDWHAFGMLRNIKVAKLIPMVLELSEVHDLLSNIRSFHAYVFFYTIYSCGLRFSECRNLKVSNIHRKRGVLRIIGKGNKEREIPLPKFTLDLLTKYWETHRNPVWFFPALGHSGKRGGTSKHPMSDTTPYKIWAKNLEELGLKDRGITPHTLRHSYATHLLDAGVNIRQLQRYLGHTKLETTAIYLHLTKDAQGNAKKIIDELMGGHDEKRDI